MKIVKPRKHPNNYQRSLTRGFRACMDMDYDNYALVAWNDKTGAFNAHYYTKALHPFLIPTMAEKLLTYQVHLSTEASDED